MPVFDKNPKKLYKDFVQYINRILNKTITSFPLYCKVLDPETMASMQFAESRKVPIGETSFLFTINQTLVANCDHGVRGFARQFKLETHEYHYYIWKEDVDNQIIRFDYQRHLREAADHCRHHCHIAAKNWDLDFDHLHIPTGWVLIEDFIRFIIVDMKCPPLSNKDKCLKELKKSEDMFFKNLSSKEINPQNLAKQ